MASIGINDRVSVMAVRNVLGYPSTDVGTLCSCPNINKWAKYKPVNMNFTTNRPSDWWKAADRQCGLSVPSAFGVGAIIELARGGSNLWAYVPPHGGSLSPYRLGDFRGYNHDAINPVRVTAFPSVAYKDTTPTLDGAIDKQYVDDTNLSLTDIGGSFSVEGTYPGVIVARVGETSGQLVTDSSLFSSQDSGGVSIPISSLVTDVEYDFIYVLSEIRQTTFGPVTDGSAYFIVIPSDMAVQRVRILEGGITCYPTAYKSGLRVHWTLRFRNTSNTQVVTVTDVSVYIVYGDFVFGQSTLEAGETIIGLPDQRIVKGTDTVVTGEEAGLLPEYSERGGKIIVIYTYLGRQNRFESPFENPE